MEKKSKEKTRSAVEQLQEQANKERMERIKRFMEGYKALVEETGVDFRSEMTFTFGSSTPKFKATPVCIRD